jgi:hypothetical protein
MCGPELGGVAAENTRDAAKPERRNIFAKERAGFGAIIDEQGEGCAARQRFDAKGARPGEEVDDASAGDRVAIGVRQNIEQRLAKPVGCGTDRGGFRARQNAPAQSTADHAHQSMIPKKPAPDLIQGGYRFPACAKPSERPLLSFDASAGKANSEKIMRK